MFVATSLEAAYKAAEATAMKLVSLEVVRAEEEQRKSRTWRDIPQEELAERLSKGEVIARDEWVPGLSEGRRKLNPEMLKSHIEFGERIHKEGNEAYQKDDYELALTRYTQVGIYSRISLCFNSLFLIQGVNLLNWVQAETEEETQNVVDPLLLIFLRNQAQAALQLEQYQTAKSEFSSVIL